MAGSQSVQHTSKPQKTRVRWVENLPQTAARELKVKGGSTSLMLACATGQHFNEATLTVRGK